jgi:hypothetical protein
MECPKANEDCRFAKQGCFENTHHLYYPKKLYRDSIGRIFRELPENKIRMCANEHVELHSTEAPPIKPGRQEMLDAIASYVVGQEYGETEVA